MKPKTPTRTKGKVTKAAQKAGSRSADPKTSNGKGVDKKRANPPKTEGLTPLDRQRASSLADEGGTSAAAVEHEETARRREWDFDGDSLETAFDDETEFDDDLAAFDDEEGPSPYTPRMGVRPDEVRH
jgi:hypothetical protein